MIDWDVAVRIFFFGLSTVFGSLALLIVAIYAFGKIVRLLGKRGN